MLNAPRLLQITSVLYAEEEIDEWDGGYVTFWMDACTTDLEQWLEDPLLAVPQGLHEAAGLPADAGTHVYQPTLSQYCDIANSVALQLFRALAYLHDEVKIAHRDLKPSNIGLIFSSTLSPPRVQLFDFGVSFDLAQGKEEPPHGSEAPPPGTCCVTAVATGGYRAPELLFSPVNGYDGRMIDIWGAGCTLAKFYTGFHKLIPPKPVRESFGDDDSEDEEEPVDDTPVKRERSNLFQVKGAAEIPLAANIFELRGLPTDEREWPVRVTRPLSLLRRAALTRSFAPTGSSPFQTKS